MNREPHIKHEGRARTLHIADEAAFINWTVLDHFARDDMGLSDESDLRRAVVWAKEEIKTLAFKVEEAEARAAVLKVQLDDETDRPIWEALRELGWTPPGDAS